MIIFLCTEANFTMLIEEGCQNFQPKMEVAAL